MKQKAARRAKNRLRDEKEREERRLAVGGFGGAGLFRGPHWRSTPV